MIRQPVVSGQFYPNEIGQLKEQLNSYIDKDCKKSDVLGVISPHAGYMFSGRVAGHVFSQINIPDNIIILAPNHTGYGPPYSVWPDGSWRTPMGDVNIDEELVDRLVSSSDVLTKDYDAHKQEHSAEVILPFLQYLNPEIKIVVIVVMSRKLEELKELGRCISRVINDSISNTLVVASSDMTHQEPEASANKKDKIAIDEIIKLNEDGLYEKVNELDISMCGVYPTISMMTCSKERGASSANLVKYETSGKTTGDYDRVVGYAGVIIK